MKTPTNIFLLATALLIWPTGTSQHRAAVVGPRDHATEMLQDCRRLMQESCIPAPRCAPAPKANRPVMLVARKKHPHRMFGAGQFVCPLPIQSPVFSTICELAEQAEETVKKIKAQGYDEIMLTGSGEVYEALVKTAKASDIRVVTA